MLEMFLSLTRIWHVGQAVVSVDRRGLNWKFLRMVEGVCIDAEWLNDLEDCFAATGSCVDPLLQGFPKHFRPSTFSRNS